MRSQLERAINLAASSVVMDLDDYENLLNGQNKGRNSIKNLTEEELLDKINHDIISWKEANSDKKFFDDITEDESSFTRASAGKEDFADEPAFAKAMADEEDDFSAVDDEIDPDFTPPNFDAEGNIIPEAEEEAAEPVKIVEEPTAAEAKVDEDQNVYYYHEPSSASATAGEAGNKEENGFTSIKDELKNRKHWEIPEEVKKSAEDVRI